MLDTVQREEPFDVIHSERDVIQTERGIRITVDRNRDEKLTEFGKETLSDRYLMPDEDFQVTVIDLQDKSAVDDDDLARVAALTELYAIRLTGTSVTDAGIKHLAGLKKLVGVTLDGTKVTEAGIAELKNSLPDCRVVK